MLDDRSQGAAAVAAPDDDMPNLIVPTNLAPVIDLTKPEDCPDLPDGEWSKRHLAQFLARQPRDMVFIPKESWEPKGVDCFQIVGLQGHYFRVVKDKAVQVPVQIATIIKQSQEEFPTMQSKSRRQQLTDVRDLPDLPGARGAQGVEVFVNR
jgi:hypothetical protein